MEEVVQAVLTAYLALMDYFGKVFEFQVMFDSDLVPQMLHSHLPHPVASARSLVTAHVLMLQTVWCVLSTKRVLHQDQEDQDEGDSVIDSLPLARLVVRH